jgi:hypothetical protein
MGKLAGSAMQCRRRRFDPSSLKKRPLQVRGRLPFQPSGCRLGPMCRRPLPTFPSGETFQVAFCPRGKL